MSAPVQSVETPFLPVPPDAAARNRIVIGLLLVATFVVILNETIMGVALPRLMEDLAIPAATAQWLTSAFLLTMAIVIPTTGFLMQRLTTRAVFILAMAMFCAGTLIAALSPGFAMLLAGRVVQAVGTAIMLPLLMTTTMTLVPAEKRGQVMGNISIVISVAPALGPTISGLILNYLDWRWMFWLVLPIALAALGTGWAMMRNVTETRKAPLDLVSVALSALGFGGLVYGLSALGEGGHGTQALPLWVAPVVGVAALVLFILRQLRLQRDDRALLDLRTLRIPAFALSLTLLGVSMMALFGAIILLPILMQNVMGLTTLQSGLILLPGGLLMGLMAPWVGRQFDRHGPRPLVLPGAVLATLALVILALSGASVPLLVAAHLVLSVGLALLFTPLFSSGLGALPPHLYSHGSAMVGAVQQVAGAAGIAALVSAMTLRTGNLLADGAEPVAAISGGIHLAFMLAAAASVAAVIGAAFVRRPAEGMTGHH